MSGLLSGQGVLSFRLPACPPSMNAIYNVMFAMRRIELKPEVRLFKNNMKMYVPSWEVGKEDQVSISLEVVDNWFFKNGNFRKADVQNVGKVVIDLICEKQGWDDSNVWSFSATKRHSDTEHCVNVKMSKIISLPKGDKPKG